MYQFTRMPFGLHRAAAIFQRLVEKLLEAHSEYVAAYIDDVIIYSQTWEEHLEHLETVIKKIKQAGLTINPEKCKTEMRSTQ